MIYNGSKWILNDRDESIQNLIDDKESIMEQKIEEWIENGNQYPDIMKKFRKYIDKKENDVVLNKIKGEIKLMLFNNRDIIVNN
jgi:5,10-methenyltetrahydromethanopterin hydrogenase